MLRTASPRTVPAQVLGPGSEMQREVVPAVLTQPQVIYSRPVSRNTLLNDVADHLHAPH